MRKKLPWWRRRGPCKDRTYPEQQPIKKRHLVEQQLHLSASCCLDARQLVEHRPTGMELQFESCLSSYNGGTRLAAISSSILVTESCTVLLRGKAVTVSLSTIHAGSQQRLVAMSRNEWRRRKRAFTFKEEL